MDRKGVVLDYLERCNTYAEESIVRKTERGEALETESWKSYIEFNNHAIEEINNGTLDLLNLFRQLIFYQNLH